MRIIAGKLKGTTLHFSQNKITRPLKDRARESIFNLLTHSNKMSFQFEKSNILDLYAGTGSFGLECLSRQARSVCFIEKAKDARKILEKNIEKLKVKKNVDIFFDDVFDLMKKRNIFKSKFDLIFCDPPFKDLNIEKLIDYIANCKIPKFPISGDYLKKHGYETGQVLGKKLKSLEEKWIENNFIIEKKTIEKSLDKVNQN